MDCVYSVVSKKYLPNSRTQWFSSMFSTASFIILVISFRSMIHFVLILWVVWGIGLSSPFLHMDILLSQHHLLNRQSLPQWIFLARLSKINYFFLDSQFFNMHPYVYIYYLDNWSLTLISEIGKWKSSNFIFFQIVLAILYVLYLHINYWVWLLTSAKSKIKIKNFDSD